MDQYNYDFSFIALPNIYWDDVEILYYVNYYDGPLDGMMRYNGDKYWFTCIDERYRHAGVEETERQRVFVLYKPYESQIAEQDHWHNYFESCKKTDKLDEFYNSYKNMKFSSFTNEQAAYILYENVW